MGVGVVVGIDLYMVFGVEDEVCGCVVYGVGFGCFVGYFGVEDFEFFGCCLGLFFVVM